MVTPSRSSLPRRVRSPHDELAKELYSHIFERVGVVQAHARAVAAAQYVDLVVEVDPNTTDVARELQEYGMLARMVDHGVVLWEFFRRPPSTAAILLCLGKQITWWRAQDKGAEVALDETRVQTPRRAGGALKGKRGTSQSARMQRPLAKRPPRLWFVCAGKPRKALRALGFAASSEWPCGVYLSPPGHHAGVIVTSELPATRETLFLRLLGSGATFRAACREVDALPPGARSVVRRALLFYAGWLGQLPAQHVDEETLMAVDHSLYNQWYQENFGEAEARGETSALVRAVLAVLEARGIVATADQAKRISDCSDPKQLERWLTAAATATSLHQLFGS